MKRITRERRLTEEEAVKYAAIRREVEAEKPEMTSRIRQHMAQKRKVDAHQLGQQTLGERIQAAREAKGKSQVTLAAAAGISPSYLAELEKDEREPSLSTAARLARALEMSLDQLAAGAA